MLYFRQLARSNAVDLTVLRQLQAEVADHIQNGLRLRAIGHVLVAAVVVALLSGIHPTATLAGWFSGLLLLVVGAAAVQLHANRIVPQPSAAARLRTCMLAEGVIGLGWMVGEMVLLPACDLPHRATVFMFLNLWGAALMQSLGAHLPTLYAVWLPMVAGVLSVVVFHPGPYVGLALLITVLWFVVILTFTVRFHRTLMESLILRHRADALAADLLIEKDRALALSQSRSRFLAAASHDLRQPVHALLLFVAALRQQPPPDETRQLLGQVDDTVHAMERMFNGLLEMSRLDAAMVLPVPRAVELQGLLAPAVAEEAAVAGVRGLKVTFTADAWPLPRAHSDPLMLERIVRNLLSNAVRYTQQGGVRLHVRRRAGGVDLRVVDSGIGIAREHQSAIYQEFLQLHAPGGRRTEGLGLGLAIVKRMCELLGHRLTLRSRPGRGSIFTIRLALALELPRAAQQTGVAAPQALAAASPVGVVVIVDERTVTGLALQTLISGWGHRAWSLAGLTGLENLLASLDAAPGVIVCDSGADGGQRILAAIERLRMEFNEDIPVVLLTDPAHAGVPALQRLAGVAVVAKPVNEQTLRAALGAALQPQA